MTPEDFHIQVQHLINRHTIRSKLPPEERVSMGDIILALGDIVGYLCASAPDDIRGSVLSMLQDQFSHGYRRGRREIAEDPPEPPIEGPLLQ